MSDDPLYDLMRQGESGPAGYDAFNRGTHKGQHHENILNPVGSVRHEPITTSTIGKIQERQKLPTNNESRLGAVGQYQVIEGTLKEAQSKLGLRDDEVLDQNVQDRIFSDHLLKTAPAVMSYIEGRPGVSREQAQVGLAQQWASFSDPRQRDHGSRFSSPANHATISLEASAEALDTLRARYAEAYRAAVAGHDANPEQAAWHAATAVPPEQRERWDRIQGPAARPGDAGPAVTELQGELNRLQPPGAASLARDGSYDRDTTRAVEGFQRAHHLAADGVAGPKTRLALAVAAGDVLAERPVAGADHRLQTPVASPTPAPVTSAASSSAGRAATDNPWHRMTRSDHPNAASVSPPKTSASHDPWRKPRAEPAPRPVLAEGRTGRSVRALQWTLDADGARDGAGRPLHVDGVFGPRTAGAVRSFQEAHGLGPDGVVGRQTRAALDAPGAAPGPNGSHDPQDAVSAMWRKGGTAVPAAERPLIDGAAAAAAASSSRETPTSISAQMRRKV